MERARRVVMAVISVVTIWASSLRSASAATNARRGERDESLENRAMARGAGRDDDAENDVRCVCATGEGWAREGGGERARRTRRARTRRRRQTTRRGGDSRKVRTVRTRGRCARARVATGVRAPWVGVLDRVVRKPERDGGSQTNRARRHETKPEGGIARATAGVGAVYEGRVQTSVEHLLRQIDARSTYDAEYVRNATTSLRVGAAPRLYAESRYDAMRNSSSPSDSSPERHVVGCSKYGVSGRGVCR